MAGNPTNNGDIMAKRGNIIRKIAIFAEPGRVGPFIIVLIEKVQR